MKHTVRYEQLRIYTVDVELQNENPDEQEIINAINEQYNTADLSFEDNLGGIEESIAE